MSFDSTFEQLASLSAERMGRLLHAVRTRRGEALATVAARAGLAEGFLADIEDGLEDVHISELGALARWYGIEPSVDLARRVGLVVDLANGVLAAGPYADRLIEGIDARIVLGRYVRLVRVLRGIPSGPLELRTIDLHTLACTLEMSHAELVERLQALMVTEVLGNERLDASPQVLSWFGVTLGTGTDASMMLAPTKVVARRFDSITAEDAAETIPDIELTPELLGRWADDSLGVPIAHTRSEPLSDAELVELLFST